MDDIRPHTAETFSIQALHKNHFTPTAERFPWRYDHNMHYKRKLKYF